MDWSESYSDFQKISVKSFLNVSKFFLGLHTINMTKSSQLNELLIILHISINIYRKLPNYLF